MAIVLGIDLGTSSVKAMLLNTESGVIGFETEDYSVDIPKSGYAEQSPGMWLKCTVNVLRLLSEQYPSEYAQVDAVGLSGQMHGLVVVDSEGSPLRSAILWLDQRSGKQAKVVREAFPQERMGKLLHNRVFPGFAFCSLLWLKENEPEVFESISEVMLPKDYLRYFFTGKIGTDYSDASGTGMFNTGNGCWSYELIDYFGIKHTILPELGHSADTAGYITEAAAKLTGLRTGTPVVYGAGDQPAQSIGNGLVYEGALISNIGTGGQIACFSKIGLYDELLRTQTFCHALPGAFTIFGATLSGGMSLNWFANKLLHVTDFKTLDGGASEIPAGSGGLIYLPYLSGERTPHMDVHAKGIFFGVTLGLDERHFTRAVMEGVVYSLKDSLEIIRQMGIRSNKIIASGGGASSPLWLQMQADILEMEVQVCTVKEQACLGACILAALGIGVYKSAEEGCAKHVSFCDEVYSPDTGKRTIYRKGYEIYRELYARTRDLMLDAEALNGNHSV